MTVTLELIVGGVGLLGALALAITAYVGRRKQDKYDGKLLAVQLQHGADLAKLQLSSDELRNSYHTLQEDIARLANEIIRSTTALENLIPVEAESVVDDYKRRIEQLLETLIVRRKAGQPL